MAQGYDAIIVGAGQAGPPLAERLTRAGQTVALVERKLFGGTCVNTGCTPTKALVASAYAAHLAFRAHEYGILIDGAPRIDMPSVKARALKIASASRDGVEAWLRSMRGCSVFHAHATFESADTLQVGTERITAPRIFLNVGGRAAVPDLPGLADIPYLTNSSILTLDHVPAHLVVIGGSYIGLEFAQMYRRFGAEVTIIERGLRLISREDEDVSSAIGAILRDEGIGVRTGAECMRFARHDQGLSVGLASGETIVGSDVLIAVGRRPNTDDLGLGLAGIETDARGYIKVDDELATSAPGVWALGDCNGRGAFTHTSYNDYEIVAANLLESAQRRVSDRVPAYALYTDPPLGRVGLTETQAREKGRPIKVGRRPMTRVGRAVEKGESKGFMKVVVDADNHQILGAAILGVGGDEAIHGLIDVISSRQTYDVLKWAVPIHPTVSELIPTLLGELKPA